MTGMRVRHPLQSGRNLAAISLMLLTVFFFGNCRAGPPKETSTDTDRPNILLIMADDMGYSDPGPFGSEIETPNLDRLASRGTRFTQFYNMAKCQTTRASLLTGQYMNQANLEHTISLPRRLRRAGYYTAAVGKQHYTDWYPDSERLENVFDDTFLFSVMNPYFFPRNNITGTMRYRDEDIPLSSESKNRYNPFTLNGEEQSLSELDVRKRPMHKTDVHTNYGLRFLDRAQETDRPFFLYMAYHAPHYPLQAREEDVQKYVDRYMKGWDRLRRERFERQKELGVLPPKAVLTEPEDNVTPHGGEGSWAQYDPWSSFSRERKKELAREMAVYAAMIDRLDRNVGRLLDRLREHGEYENTLIVFLSDNGACPYDNGGYTGHGDPPFGSPGSYSYQRPEWASLANTPWRYFKQYGHHGGSLAPFIVAGPGVEAGEITHQPGHVVDLMPTFFDAAGLSYPGTSTEEPVPELDGSSLMPVFRGEKRKTPDVIVSGWRSVKRTFRLGRWKLVNLPRSDWELYDVSSDPSERNNLAEEQPDRVDGLFDRVEEWKTRNGAK